MKNQVFTILALFSIVIYGCTNTQKLFSNRVLIYNSEYEDGSVEQNTSFIDYYNDTINMIGSSLDLSLSKYGRDSAALSLSKMGFAPMSIYPYSGVPFKFIRRNDSIHITYKNSGVLTDRVYFVLNKKDSIYTPTFANLCSSDMGYNWAIIRYLGDTVINVVGKKMHCWKISEIYRKASIHAIQYKILYIERKSLVPVQINDVFIKAHKNFIPGTEEEVYKSRIGKIILRPWVSSDKKWQYPKCWKP